MSPETENEEIEEEELSQGEISQEEEESEHYYCTCGFHTDDQTIYKTHLLQAGQGNIPGKHRGGFRLDVKTGDIYPASRSKKKRPLPAGSGYLTTDQNQATTFRAVPRIMTFTHTPIMQAGYAAAVNVWGWRKDMPIENFFDTIIYNFFKEHGIQLAGYIIEDEEAEEEGNATSDTIEANPNGHKLIELLKEV